MSLEAINTVRKLQGMEPLLALPKEGESPIIAPTAEEIEAKRIADEAVAAEEAKKKATTTPPIDPELTDDQLLKLLEKRGIKADSIEGLKAPAPPVDPVKLAEQREADELAYGLSKGLFNKKDYDGFIRDSQDPQDLVYAQYHSEAKSEDPELTDDDIRAEFAAKYGLDAEPGTRLHKQGVKAINTLAESLLKQKYGKVYDAKSSFSTYEKETTTAKDNESKVLAAAPTYKKDVEDIFTALKKIPFKFSDTESYEVEAVQANLDELQEMMLRPEYSKGRILGGYKKETLAEEVKAAFLYKNFPYLAKEVANQHLLKHSAGTKGIPMLGGSARKEGDTPVLTDAQKKYIELDNAAKAKREAIAN